MMTFRILALSLLLTLSSCMEKKIYDKNTCEKLAMQSFKGMPRAATDFKNNCMTIKIDVDYKLCQEVLSNLVLTGDVDYIVKRYGARLLGCVSDNDIKKFTKPQKK